MTTARDIMTDNPTSIRATDTVADAARRMAELDVGALPICGTDQRLEGMITDRDIAIRVIAEGRDPVTTTVGELAQGEAVTIGADDPIDEALQTMTDHQVRRLPVIDGTELVGIVSQADVARNLPEEKVGELVEAISQ